MGTGTEFVIVVACSAWVGACVILFPVLAKMSTLLTMEIARRRNEMERESEEEERAEQDPYRAL